MGAIATLAQSRQDGAPEAPELKARRAYTQRSFALTEVRLSDAGTPDPVIEGYAAVFDQPTVIQDWFGGYRETIAPGAFKKTIREADVRALFNHTDGVSEPCGRRVMFVSYPADSSCFPDPAAAFGGGPSSRWEWQFRAQAR